MKVYTTINQVYVENSGWVKPDTLDNFNDVTTINYNYVEFVGSPDGRNVTTQTGQEDVPIERSRECLYADGCRIHRSTFFKK